jgi:tetratricopeptide (TPR) repeat protein
MPDEELGQTRRKWFDVSRLDANAILKQRTKERFCFECAACGKASRLTADVAHLFEDATTRAPQADRLIVLCSSCNQAEDRAKARSNPPLSELFDAEAVSVRAQHSYREGRYPCAYQGHRLAAYLFEARGFHSNAVASLVEAISAARPIRWGDFLKATFIEVERLCLSHNVGVVQRWLFLDRLALVLYDYRRWRETAQVQYASMQLRARVRNDPRYPEELRFDRASSFRREALIWASTKTEGRTRLGTLLGRLIEDAKEFEHQGQFDGYATNLDVAGKLALEIGGDPEKAHQYSQEALERAEKITHKWVMQEHYWREAEYYRSRNDRPLTLQSVVEALRLFRDHPVVLEPTLGAAGPTPHDPIAELARFGVSVEELRELEVAPSRNPPPELALLLSRSMIDRIVTNCM